MAEIEMLVFPDELQYATSTDPLDLTEGQILEIQNWILEQIKADPLEYVLRPRQIQALISFMIQGDNIAVFLPTGYGKTIIALLCAIYTWQSGKKTIYIGMLRALAAEMLETFSKQLPSMLDMGGKDRKTIDDYINNEWVIACLTPEKFNLLMQNQNKRDFLMDTVGLIITDEAHNIGDKSRGRVMESYIIKCRLANPELRYINLSATVGNPEEFADWLESDLIMATPSERPVPLNLEILPYEEQYYHWNQDLPDVRANYKIRVGICRELVSDPVYENRVWLFFSTSRARAESIVGDLSGIHRRNNEKDAPYLDRLMAEGYAFHHRGIPEDYKLLVADGLRDGSIRFCGATPTLAVGVNVFANCCVLLDSEQFDDMGGSEGADSDSKWVVLDPNRTQQTMGRAGRPVIKCPQCGGKVIKNRCQNDVCEWDNIGYAFIIPPERLEEQMEYNATHPLEVKSQLKAFLHAEIISWIESGLVNDILDILDMCEYSYADISEQEAYDSIAWLKCFGFVIEKEGTIGNTYIGKMTAVMGIMPETCVKWQSQICNIRNPDSIEEVFTRFASVKEYYSCVTVRSEDEKLLELTENHLGYMFPSMKKHCDGRMCLTCSVSRNCVDKEYIVSNCENYESNIEETIRNEVKKCFGLSFYNDIVPIVEKNRKLWNPKTRQKEWVKVREPAIKVILSQGDVKILKESGSRIFAAAGAIFSKHKRLSNTLKLLEKFCMAGTLNKALVALCSLKRIGYKKAKAIYDAGYHSIQQFFDADNTKLSRLTYITDTGKKISIGSPRVLQNIKVLNLL